MVNHLIVIAVYDKIGVLHFCDIGGDAQVCERIAGNVLRGGGGEILIRKVLYRRKGAKMILTWEQCGRL